VRVSLRRSLALGAILAVAAAQAPNYRVTYRLRVFEGAAPGARLLATAVVSGPPETDLRLSLRAAALEIQALLGILPEPDTVNVAGLFYTRREAGRSRRGLPLWEEDSYRRWARVAWGGTTRLYPFGPASVSRRGVVWIEIAVGHEFAAGETRASEEATVIDSTIGFTVRAVIPPRRVTARLTLVRNDASTSRTLDLVPDAPVRRVAFTLGGATSQFDVTLERPEPPRTGRDSVLAVEVDVVCLRVLVAGSADPARIRCGRLDNVARRIALTGRDTLVATFAWPAVR
jgi:hypothetical protein